MNIEQFGVAILQDDSSYKYKMEGKKLYVHQFKEHLGKNRKYVRIKITTETVQDSKTWEQLKYLRGPVLQLCLGGFHDLGHKDFINTEQVLTRFKMWWFNETIDGETQPRSLTGAGKEELFEFTEKIREFAQTHLNVYVMSGEEYYDMIEMEEDAGTE